MVSSLKLDEAPDNSLHLHGISFGTWVVSYLAKIIPTKVRYIGLSGPWYNGFQLATHYVASSVVTTLCDDEASYGWDTAGNIKALLTSNDSCVVEVAVDVTTQALWGKFKTDHCNRRDFTVHEVAGSVLTQVLLGKDVQFFLHKPNMCNNQPT